MSVNPLAWYIGSAEGYNITCHRNEKITHSLYVDDLKTYHKSRNKAAVMSTTIKSMFADIGFEWGLQKCAAVEVNRGKLTEGGNLTVSKEESIQIVSKDDHYKFLGTVENSKQLDELITQNIKPRIHSQAIGIGNLDKQHQYPKKDQSHQHFCNSPSTIFILDVHMNIRKVEATRS